MEREPSLDADGLARRIAELSPQRREMLERLLSTKSDVARSAAIPRRPSSGSAPVSFAQERLWFLDQLLPGNANYNYDNAVRFRTPLDEAVLARSLNEIVARHEALRTTFQMVAGQPVQVIAPSVSVPLPVIDLRAYPETERETEAQRLAAEEARRPFDLATGPLIRASLLRLDEGDHILLLTTHHIISDAWSLVVLFRELGALCAAFGAGERSPLAPLPIQYADFAVWQRQWLQGQVLRNQLAYWKRQLAGLGTLELPTDHPRPAIHTPSGASISVTARAGLLVDLKKLGQRHDVTLNMTLLAAFQALLHRYSGQDDVAVGSPIAGRDRAETADLIGIFINTLVLRTDCSGNPTFRELLRRVRDVALAAYAHQDAPFEMVVEELRPVRDLSHTPLFQVAFSLLSGVAEDGDARRRPHIDEPGVTVLEVETGTAKFDLTVLANELPEGLTLMFQYRTDLFESASIRRMANHYLVLLERVAANPDQPLSRLPLLAPAERQQILDDWSQTAASPPAVPTIHRLFEAQAERRPDAVAAMFGADAITYGELNARANQLAHYLRARGVGLETFVGIFMERSLETMVALLGALKAGGAYVPLDARYPKERLDFMIADARVPVLLTQQRLLDRLGEQPAHVICMDSDWRSIAGEDSRNPTAMASAESLAYVIYTSGSTGRPKAVMIQHGGACNAADVMSSTLGIGFHDRVLQFASLSFDASACEILMAVGPGAALCLADQASLLPGPPLMQLLRDQGISAVLLPPAVLASLEPDGLPALQTVSVCGEPFSADLVQRWTSGRRFFNLFGPTETTMFVTMAECFADRRPTIGRPIANTQAFVLDRHLEPLPPGIPGELLAGGVGLARGYLHRPELTAEKFIAHPFSNDQGARLYKTGDLVRYRPDGTLEFLGRVDHQVKIRGFRVELGEVEAALLRHPNLREVTVLAREDQPGEKRLVAYVVSREEPHASATELRRLLRRQLPEYMVPAAFVWIERLPLTPSGKIDRAALPLPDPLARERNEGWIAPRSELERAICTAWQEMLHVDRVGIDDNFFELGGHSLLITRVQVRLQEMLGRELSIVELFQFPTVGALAAHLTEARALESTLGQVQKRAAKQRQAISRLDAG